MSKALEAIHDGGLQALPVKISDVKALEAIHLPQVGSTFLTPRQSAPPCDPRGPTACTGKQKECGAPTEIIPHTKALEAIHSPPVGSKPFTSKFLMSRPLRPFIRHQWA